jgi:NADH-quinone oxidoreductase subunit N
MTDVSLVHAFVLTVPEMILIGISLVVFLGGTWRQDHGLWACASLVALALTAGSVFWCPLSEITNSSDVHASPIFNDHLGVLIRWLALLGGAALVLLSWNEVSDRFAAEYYGCLLLTIAGLSLTAVANDLITLFIALELISIPTYIILYLPQSGPGAQEAAMKYFLLSVFSSAISLFGFSYIYGLVGTTNIPAIVQTLAGESPLRLPPVVVIVLVTVMAGFGFRITAVPFHYYAPDVYQGAPTASAALLAFITKAAGFTALLRLLGLVWAGRTGGAPVLGDQVPVVLWILTVATMTLGNVLALWQSNVKRLLAYSSVAHAGYMLIGLTIASGAQGGGERAVEPGGVADLLFYLVAYAAMTIGAFGVLVYLSTPGQPIETEDDLAGLAQHRPLVALLMAIFLFSLIGIPLTGGFNGKLLLFWNALADRSEYQRLFRWLAIIGVINAAVAAFYYLRILARMYFQPSTRAPAAPTSAPGLTALLGCALVTIVLGVVPELLVRYASRVTAPVRVLRLPRSQDPLLSAANQGSGSMPDVAGI